MISLAPITVEPNLPYLTLLDLALPLLFLNLDRNFSFPLLTETTLSLGCLLFLSWSLGASSQAIAIKPHLSGIDCSSLRDNPQIQIQHAQAL